MDNAGVGLGCGEGRVITMVIIIGTDNNCAVSTTWYCDLIICFAQLKNCIMNMKRNKCFVIQINQSIMID